MADDHHGGLDLGVVVRVVGGEEADRTGVDCLEPRRGVGELLPRQQRDEPGEPADPRAAREGRLVVAAALGEAGADDDVRLASLERREQVRDLLRVATSLSSRSRCRTRASAYLNPVWTALPMPRLKGRLTTAAPAAVARAAV